MTAVEAAHAQRAFALRLYKALLVAHRMVLDPEMRMLGDSYVREEFKRHKDAKPQHVQPFFQQWLSCMHSFIHSFNHTHVNQLDTDQMEWQTVQVGCNDDFVFHDGLMIAHNYFTMIPN